MSKEAICFACGKKFDANKAGLAMNMGFGPQYWCQDCKPPASGQEVGETIERFINPKKEMPEKDKQ